MTMVLLGVAAAAAVSFGLRRRQAVRQVPDELRAGWLYLPAVVPPITPWPAANRAVVKMARRLMRRASQVVPGTQVQRRTLTLPGDGAEVPAYVYAPARRATPSGALLWIHGGDLVVGDAAQDHDLCSHLATRLGILVVSPDYRLAPEHRFPAALDDCWSALRWLHRHADGLQLDRSLIAVGGASAGGGLAASLAQRAYDEQLAVAFQLLVYPMLDDRTALRRTFDGRGRLAFTPAMDRFGWAGYLGRPPGRAEPGRYAAAARRRDLAGLPPAWIGVGDLDLVHDEAVDYAHRLRAAGVACDLHVEPGMYHGADVQLASSVASMRRFRDLMTDSLGDRLRRGEAGQTA